MDILNLFAVLSLNAKNYKEGLAESEDDAKSFGAKISKGLGTAAKAGAAALGAAGAAVVALTKSSVGAYGEQEQLVGGVQKLYGNMGMSVEEYAASVGKSVAEVSGDWQSLENAQNTVLKNAQNAYKTAGMSANQYMQTATSFSAALINSLGGNTQKAADQTEVAMRAISDNVNTFGSDMGSVQYAFQGFAKQNYTMLDNLKLGYGGTKTEMERLIKDANEYGKATGQASDLTIDSFSDIVTAIDLVQQKQGIAGTTAREAASTIQGSLSTLKGAWDNLLAGLGDADADIGTLVDNVVSSAETVLTNVMPVIQTALTGLGRIITDLAPIIAEKLPEFVEMVLPPMLEAATSLLTSLAAALPELIMVIINMIPTLIQSFIDGFTAVVGNLDIIGSMSVSQILASITSFLGSIADKGVEIVLNLISGAARKAPAFFATMSSMLSTAITYIMQNYPRFLSKGVEIVGKIVNGLLQAAPTVLSAMASMMVRALATIAQNLPQYLQKGIEIIGKIAAGIIQAIPRVITTVLQVIVSIVNSFKSYNWLQIGMDILNGIKNGILNAVSGVISAAKSAASSIFNAVKGFFHIGSPSKLMRDQIGKNIGIGMALGIGDSERFVDRAVDGLNKTVMDGMMTEYPEITGSGVFSASANGGGSVLAETLRLLQALYGELPGHIVEAVKSLSFAVNDREFGRMVKSVGQY